MPVGAEVTPAGVSFRVWAPQRKCVEVVIADGLEQLLPVTLEAEGNGYFSGVSAAARTGSLYHYRLDSEADLLADPASRFQPEGPLGPSQVIDPSTFTWTDAPWKGVTGRGDVIYEMHIGTFSQAGTWRDAIPQLPALAALGITILEVMPVADFAGSFGWGYDGVNMYAPTRLYGGPDDFRAFVDAAHACGLGVILDVVYNHLGPVGNMLPQFSPYYLSEEHGTDWGQAINFSDANCEPVREFFITNAGYWISEFHLDGLRLDATQNIYDFDASSDHILAEVCRQARAAAVGRDIFIVGENEPQDVSLLLPAAEAVAVSTACGTTICTMRRWWHSPGGGKPTTPTITADHRSLFPPPSTASCTRGNGTVGSSSHAARPRGTCIRSGWSTFSRITIRWPIPATACACIS